MVVDLSRQSIHKQEYLGIMRGCLLTFSIIYRIFCKVKAMKATFSICLINSNVHALFFSIIEKHCLVIGYVPSLIHVA